MAHQPKSKATPAAKEQNRLAISNRPNGKAPKKNPKTNPAAKDDSSKWEARQKARAAKRKPLQEAHKKKSELHTQVIAVEIEDKEKRQREKRAREKRVRAAKTRLNKSQQIIDKVRAAK